MVDAAVATGQRHGLSFAKKQRRHDVVRKMWQAAVEAERKVRKSVLDPRWPSRHRTCARRDGCTIPSAARRPAPTVSTSNRRGDWRNQVNDVPPTPGATGNKARDGRRSGNPILNASRPESWRHRQARYRETQIASSE